MSLTDIGAEAFPASLDSNAAGQLAAGELTGEDYQRAAELMCTYKDLKFGFVDRAMLAIVERLAEPKLATLDHRHFATKRARRAEARDLLPA